jgi:hypothetical protein
LHSRLTLIFSGVQRLTLGIMDEYLARVHFLLMQRPSYTVRCDNGSADEQ